MTALARTYPPGTFIVQERVTLTRENFGTSFLRWPYEWTAATYNHTPTDHRATYPQGRFAFFDADTLATKLGWIKLWKPTIVHLWNGSAIGANALAAFLETLDFWHLRGVKCLWMGGFVSTADQTHLSWDGSATGLLTTTDSSTGHEAQTKAFLVALLTSAATSTLGFTIASHPALAGVELGNELTTLTETAAARLQRIITKTFNQYRTQPTLFLGPNLEGNNRTTPVRDWLWGSALSIAVPPVAAGSPADDGTNKILLDYVDGWSQHFYTSLNTRTQIAATGNAQSNTQQGVRYGCALGHTLMPYWYGPSSAAGGKWHNGTLAKFPPIWCTEGDIAGGEVAEGSDGFMWGQLSPQARKDLFLRWFVPALFSTHDGAGNPGRMIYYLHDTNQDTLTTISGSQTTVGAGGKARITLASCGTQGAGAYDDIVLKGGANGWPELGIAANGFKRFIGELVSGTTFDLQGTSIAATVVVPADLVSAGSYAYHGRWLYVDYATYAWMIDFLLSGKVTFGYVYHPKGSVTDAPNLGIMVHVEGSRPLYTDANGMLKIW